VLLLLLPSSHPARRALFALLESSPVTPSPPPPCPCLLVPVRARLQLVNCQRMQVQVKNVVPSIAVDKTDGCVIYLSFASRGTQITTSKISEVNVSFPHSEAEDADWVRGPRDRLGAPPRRLRSGCMPAGSGVGAQEGAGVDPRVARPPLPMPAPLVSHDYSDPHVLAAG
jgi:hypothetical protein